jgi:membrane-bound lytic murein transglycosylase MltF
MDPINKGLFAIASYNAGPNKIRRLRQEAKESGFDENKWFNNVEVIVSRRVGSETTNYVANIYKYYLAYRMVTETEAARIGAKAALKK